MNFNSQICTTREQSERLIALGLKKETADMSIGHTGLLYPYPHREEEDRVFIPAWSLHRLIKINLLQFGNRFEVRLSLENVDDVFEKLVEELEWLAETGNFNAKLLED